MRKESKNYSLWQRFGALALAVVLVFGMLPATGTADSGTGTTVTKVEDPETLTRPQEIYGDNTLNAGKVTVGKSVSKDAVTVDGQNIALTGDNNFLVTISQTAQVMGLSSETSVPVDVVFVLDMSNSMSGSNVTNMVTAANDAIATLMAANEENRVAVVGFSGNQGGGTSGGAAANVLSSLAHYTGEAATNHLQWVNSEGEAAANGGYIAGRDWATIEVTSGRWPNQTVTTKTVHAFRDGTSMGTNIHAGVALGGSILADVPKENTKVNGLTRIPFLVIMSDGDPTLAAGSNNDEKWYDPSLTSQLGSVQEADGLGFLAALTAAYYKGVITENYFGSAADADNHAFVYTMGLGLSANGLGEMTMDPTGSTGSSYADEFEAYWDKYEAGNSFTVQVRGNPSTYTITADSIDDTEKYVYGTGLGYTGSYKYNDAYFSASQGSDLEQAFTDIVAEISKKAITVPTKVTTGDHDFDGYVTFTDPIGEYMELKDMKGVIADGYFYQGASAAQYLASGTNAEFNELIRKVLKTRMGLSDSDDRFVTDAELDAFIDSILATADGNSLTWWGNEYHTGEEDVQVQVVGAADNDTIEYIEAQKAAGNIPAGADYVCRSYFFYGEAGGANPNPDHEYLYFVVRVQRSIHAPYQQTVVISAPASLLSVEKVMVNETFDDNGDPVYTVSLEEATPARVVYEVGLWDSITAETVSTVVSDTYAAETVNGEGQVNYDPATDTYYFFTNDWDRSQAQNSHHRPMAKATFDAAADNAFYTYQEDTLIVNANGDPVTSNPAGTTAYYVRTYYDWANATQNADGTYTATKKTQLIKVEIPSDANLINEDGKWYIPKGAYTAATLIVNGDDVLKSDNTTNTSEIVAHPHRTGESNNSHYTVFLGNNGVISLVSNPPEPTKTVANITAQITDANGKAVMVGDVLEYKITAKNYSTETGTITITDKVPAGTELVSVADGGVHTNGTITWTLTNVAPGEEKTVSFRVKVTEAALDNAVVSSTIQNTAAAQLNNEPAYDTNTTHNPPEGKKVTIQGDPDGTSVQVGDVLVYSIEFHNDTGAVAETMTIVDKLPAGTTFLSTTHNGVYDDENHTITWTFEDVAAGAGGVVTFTVIVDASAKTPIENGATITIGDHEHTTNTTSIELDKGSLSLSKTVVIPEGLNPETDTFTLTLTEVSGKLEGTFSGVTFTKGVATVEIQHNQTITIEGLPAGIAIRVVETIPAGFTMSMTNNGQVEITANATASVAVTNTYAVDPLTVTLQGDKTLTGTSPDDEIFGFTVVPCNANGEPTGATGITGEVVLTKDTVDITFGTLTFTESGTYHYLVSEVNGGQDGVDYTAVQYLVTIVVVDNGDGTLSHTLSLKSRPDANSNFANVTGEKVLFTNHYDPEDTSITLAGTKTLVGRAQEAGEFSFVVHELDASGNVIVDTDGNPVVIATGTNKADGTIEFRPITYTQAGTHTYVISELQGNRNGVTYSTATYTITVAVADVDGVLVATVYDANGNPIDPANFAGTFTFENKFTPPEVSVTLEASKILTGRDLVEGEFSFQVLEGDTVVATGKNGTNGKITFSPIGYDIAKFVAADADRDNVVTFTYTVRELAPTVDVDPSMYYDPTEFTVTVTVERNATTGLLAVTNVAYNGDMTFENIQNPSTVSVTPVAYKTTSDAPAGVKFSFSVTHLDGYLLSSGISNANGAVDFSDIVYDYDDLAGQQSVTLLYWLQEDRGGDTHAGITYDGTRYLMQVVLSLSDTNKLEADVTYYALADGGDASDPDDYTVAITNPGENGENVKFSNKYTVQAGVSASMTVEKNLVNRALGSLKFEFGLYHITDAGEVLVATATNGTNGLVNFLRNYEAGVIEENDADGDDIIDIYYVIRELPNNVHGVNYDEAVANPVYVKVTLKDNKDGTMSSSVAYFSDEDCTTAITGTPIFTNTYTPDPITVALEASKDLTGRGQKAGEFSFVVLDDANKEVAWGTNDANGKIVFSNLVYDFDDAGKTFTYTVKEVKPDLGADPNLYYDPAVFTVTVAVSYDATTGELDAVVTYPNDMTFDNIQNPDYVVFAPEGDKTTTGEELPGGLRFSFQVYSLDTSGNHVLEGTGVSDPTAEGTSSNNKIIFTDLVVTDEEFDAADTDKDGYATFTFYIEESNTGNTHNGVKYDSSLYRYEVTITRSATNELIVHNTSYAKYDTASGQFVSVNAVAFTNEYKAETFINLTASKNLKELNLTANAFDFRLQRLDYTGKLLEGSAINGSNDSNGLVTFATLNYASDMLEDGYKHDDGCWYFSYLMSEIKPATAAIPGVTYDESKYVVTIKISQAPDGKLTAELAGVSEAVYNSGNDSYSPGEEVAGFVSTGATGVTFTNTYAVRQDTAVTMTVEKNLVGRDLGSLKFEFGLYHITDGKEVLIATTSNDGSGLASFARSYAAGIIAQYDTDGNDIIDIYYVIRELPNNIHGVDYTDAVANPVYVKVTLKDNKDGTMSSSVAYFSDEDCTTAITGTPAFTNHYTPDPITVALEASKKLVNHLGTGISLTEGQFSFVVLDDANKEVAWGTNNAAGEIVFSSIRYTIDDVGTHTYTVKEVKPDTGVDPNLYYDPAEFQVSVNVTYDPATGELDAVVTYPNDMTFDNVQNPATITVTPEGNKTTTGNVPEGTTFSFSVIDTVSGQVVGAGTSGVNGAITFSTLVYDSDDVGKTFYYWIVEDQAGNTHAGITYDSVKYLMVVEVYRDGNNYNALAATKTYFALAEGGDASDPDDYTVTVTNPGENVKFTNKYTVTQGITVEMEVSKTLNGRDMKDGEFSFTLYHLTTDSLGNPVETPVTTGTNVGGIVHFSRDYSANVLNGETSREIIYVIRENNNNLGGVDYTDALAKPIYVKVTVTDNQDGTMSWKVEYFSDAACTQALENPGFINSYETTDTIFKPVVNKVLDGRHMTDGEFSFVITDASGNPVAYGLSKAAESGKPGTVEFGSLSYTFADLGGAVSKVFTYTISEVPGNLTNVDYTVALENPIYLQVTLTDNGDGTLSVSGKYYSDKTCQNELTAPTFTNNYTTIGTTAYLEAAKTLTGRDAIDGEFSFQVTDSQGTVVATGGNNGGVVRFSGIGITETMMGGALEKDFVFTIVELTTSQGAVDFDPNTYYAKVKVKNNLTDGKLEIVSITYYTDAACNQPVEKVTFVNDYAPDPVDVKIPVHKTLVNKTMKAGDFIFALLDSNRDLIATVTNDASGNAIFQDILTYDVRYLADVAAVNGVRTKTFTYYIVECANTATNPDGGSYTYDETEYTVTVTLTDDGTGILRTKVEIKKGENAAENVAFTNYFKPDPIEVDLDAAIGATKTIVDDEGNVLTRDDVVFKFQVTDLHGNVVAEGTAEGADAVDGVIAIDFDQFTFSEPGEYRYLITESTETKAGYVLDTTVWCTHIQVRYDAVTGKLSVSDDDVYTHILSVEGHADDGIQPLVDEDPAFVNVYDTNDVHLHLTLDKKLTGDRTTLKEHEFAFQLLNSDGTIAAEGRNHTDGTVSFYLDYDFQDLNGALQRTYNYTVKEIIPEGAVDNGDGTYTLNGITYDGKSYPVTVVLKDNGDGTLTATVAGATVTGTGTVDTGIDITNTYTAADVTVAFQAIKRMEGMPLEDGIYTFLLKDGDTVLAEGTNKADGTIAFNKDLTFTEVGTYTYTMVEYKGAKPGVTFDETSFTVTVEVTDNGLGKLEAKVIYTTAEGTYDLPVFINIYKPTGVSVVIEANKELDGRELKSEFTFQLLDGEGNVIDEVNNKADGSITFESIYFDEVGTHTYTIVEVVPAEAVKNADGTYTLNGVTYDQTVYTVVVEITDPGYDGTLDKKVTYYLGTQEVDADKVVFTNIYETNEATVDVTAEKELTGKDLEDGEFSFVLVNQADKDDKYTVTNKADGTILFEDLSFSVAGTYVYDLYEVTGSDKHYTYDDTVITVTITVTDNGDGTMTAKAAYSETAVFKNTYKPEPITVVLEGSKELTGRDLVDGEFEFEVRDAEDRLVTTGTNKADGTIVFENIVIDTEMDLTLYVSEVKGNDKYVEYDDYTYRVKLVVTNENGVLKAAVQYLDGDIVFYNEYEIPETPPTGDDTPVYLYAGLMGISAVALMAVLVLGRKKKERKHF